MTDGDAVRRRWTLALGADLKRMKLGVSALAIAASFALVCGPAAAQQTPSSTPDGGKDSATAVQELVITGSSVRGQAPVGANLMTVTQSDIQATGATTLDEVLKTLPALSDMGQAGQGQHNSTYFSPNIHQLGGSASGSTLVLIDGMRMPLGGTSHSQPDPSILPLQALQRVDVLATGASSIYGSDAVAGVVNFITRDSFKGSEVDVEYGNGNQYNTYSANIISGVSWDQGNLLVAYQHSFTSDIPNASRIGNLNFISKGGTNHDNFDCSPATVQPNGSGNIYVSPTSSTNISSAQANAMCYSDAGDYLPAETRDNVFVKITHHFTDKLTISADLIYANRSDTSETNDAVLQATAFGPGASSVGQINPFYVNPPGVTASKQTIRFDLAGLLPNALTTDAAQDIYANLKIKYQLPGDWVLSSYFVATQDNSSNGTVNGFCQSCALLALNGTTNSGASLTQVSIPGTNVTVTNVPLTTANALDVWDSPANNKTSAAVLASLHSAFNNTVAIDTIEQWRVTADGTVFNEWAGPVKLAVGGEFFNNTLQQQVTKPNGTGESSFASAYSVFNFQRHVESAFGEADIPIISPGMNIPLVQKLDFDISGRFDQYSDVGSTANPKYAFNWEVGQGLKIFGDYSTSFVAPQLDSIGDPSQNYRAAYGGAGLFQTPTTFLTALYPGTAGVLPGCAANAVACQVGTATTPGISVQRGIGADAKPEIGNGVSIGASWRPTFLPNLFLSATYWNTNFQGAVTSPNASVLASVKSLNYLFRIYPNGAPPSVVASTLAPYPVLNSSPPATTYVVVDESQNNIENLSASGIDFVVSYVWPTAFGTFKFNESGTYFTKYRISFGYPQAGPSYSILNTDGQTSQFPEIQFQSRTDFGWKYKGFALDVFVNYTGSYTDWATPANPITVNALGQPDGGGDPVKAYTTIDLHAAYDFGAGWLKGDQVYVNVTNLLDSTPPFYNSQGQATTFTGTDDLVTNLIGRVTSVGLRVKF